MPIRIIETVTCAACGNSWPRDRYEELRPVDASIGYCPSCGDDGEVMDDKEIAYQRAIQAEVRSEMAIARAYPALYDKALYVEDMTGAGRGRMLRGEE